MLPGGARPEQMQQCGRCSAGRPILWAIGSMCGWQGRHQAHACMHALRRTRLMSCHACCRRMRCRHMQVLRAQDAELVDLEAAVATTRTLARAINDEVTLQTHLLEGLEEDVDVTHSRLRAATLRVKQVLRSSNSWRMGLCIFVLIVAFVLVTLIAFKVLKVAAVVG